MSAPATVTESPATCYAVRNGWAWAYIFVRHGHTHDTSGERHWAHVSVLSDFGEFGYCWSHMGGDWRAFLTSLDFDYAMRKMMGPRMDVPMTAAEAAAKAAALVCQYRRDGNVDRKEARDLFDAIEPASHADDARDFLRKWDDHSGGLMYRYDLYDHGWDKRNPQAEAFWREIWPAFRAHIAPPEPAAVAA